MNGNARTSRLWVAVLTLSLVHAPFPVYDGDDIVGTSAVGGATDSPRNRKEGDLDIDVWMLGDVDFILLGCDTPEDADEGPIDETPDDCPHCYVSSLDPLKSATWGTGNRHGLTDIGSWSDVTLTTGVERASRTGCIRYRHRNVGSTFATVQNWRFFLSVMTC